jgi:hypothetical protein
VSGIRQIAQPIASFVRVYRKSIAMALVKLLLLTGARRNEVADMATLKRKERSPWLPGGHVRRAVSFKGR